MADASPVASPASARYRITASRLCAWRRVIRCEGSVIQGGVIEAISRPPGNFGSADVPSAPLTSDANVELLDHRDVRRYVLVEIPESIQVTKIQRRKN
jgi:hypothetical protein